MKEILQDRLFRLLISGGAAIALGFLAMKVPGLAPLCTTIGTMLIPAGYKTTSSADTTKE